MKHNDNDDETRRFFHGPEEELYTDYKTVAHKTNEFMETDYFSTKRWNIMTNMPWEEWCAIWCKDKHLDGCPRSAVKSAGHEENHTTRIGV